MSNVTERLRKEYLNSFRMRNYIKSKLNTLTPSQVKKIYDTVKTWTGEEIKSLDVKSAKKYDLEKR